MTIGAGERPATVAVTGTGATTATYLYNFRGERVMRTEGTSVTRFHYDLDGQLLAESDQTGAYTRHYLRIGSEMVGVIDGAATLQPLVDHLGRIVRLADQASPPVVVWDGQFTPYGRVHAITGLANFNPRFPGQWQDAAAGYAYNYLRDYDATLGRTIQPDPLGPFGPFGGGNANIAFAGP